MVRRPLTSRCLLALATALSSTACELIADPDPAGLGVGGASVATVAVTVGAGGQGGATSTSSGGGMGGAGGQGGASATTTASAGGGGSGGGECVDAGDCPTPAAECQVATCAAGACGEGPAPAGTATATQIPGDCLETQCDGQGGTVNLIVLGDPADDGKSCTVDVCANGGPAHLPQPSGTACAESGGTVCSATGDCVECVSGAGCASGVCSVASGVCLGPTCGDGVKNGTETGTDCGGGGCTPCPPGGGCLLVTDCLSQVCTGGLCVPPACNDNTKNGTETDKDCGGGCAPCTNGLVCGVAGDCQSMVCTGNLCQASLCNDGVKNGTETGQDCGGTCQPCVAGLPCGSSADCQSQVCTLNVCQAPTCNDNTTNGVETDTDCGGGVCAACPVGDTCQQGADCQSLVCGGASTCVAPSCGDNTKNQAETGIDCGGPCAPCGTGGGCFLPTDCQSGNCQLNLCVAPTCVDGLVNQGELAVDCGGPCAPCQTVVILAAGPTTAFGAQLLPGGTWQSTPLTTRTDSSVGLAADASGGALGVLRHEETGNASDDLIEAVTFSGTTWGAPTAIGPTVFGQNGPSIDESGGIYQIAYHGTDFFHYFLTATTGAFSAPELTGVFGPQQPSLAAVGAASALAFADGGAIPANQMFVADRVSGVWSAGTSLSLTIDFNIPPAIVAPTTGPEVLAVWVLSGGQLVFATRTAGVFGAQAPIPGALTNDRPALAALAGGDVMLAFRGQDGKLYTALFTAAAWQSPAGVGTPVVSTATTPALAKGTNGASVDLAYVDGNAAIQHVRRVAGVWTAPVGVGGGAAQPVSQVALATIP